MENSANEPTDLERRPMYSPCRIDVFCPPSSSDSAKAAVLSPAAVSLLGGAPCFGLHLFRKRPLSPFFKTRNGRSVVGYELDMTADAGIEIL